MGLGTVFCGDNQWLRFRVLRVMLRKKPGEIVTIWERNFQLALLNPSAGTVHIYDLLNTDFSADVPYSSGGLEG
jgi:hypothetical protein